MTTTKHGPRGGYRSSRRRGNLIWTSIKFDNLDVLTTPQNGGGSVVATGDWLAHAGRQECTLMSIRGWLHATKQLGSTSPDTLFLAMIKHDEDIGDTDASLDPDVVQTYVDEDILWTAGWAAPGAHTLVGEAAHSHYFDVNIKAKRKVSSAEVVDLISTTNNGLIAMSGVLRALLKIS